MAYSVVPTKNAGDDGLAADWNTYIKANMAYLKGVCDTVIPAPGSPAQGNILYYNGSAWVVLAPGTSGYFLKTQGAGQNPVWDTAPIPFSTMRDGSTVAYASPSGTRVSTTVYQNTSGKTRFITVTASVNTANGTGIQAYVEAGDSTPDICVASFFPETGNGIAYFTISFMVPASSYYEVVAGNNVSINIWIEWD